MCRYKLKQAWNFSNLRLVHWIRLNVMYFSAINVLFRNQVFYLKYYWQTLWVDVVESFFHSSCYVNLKYFIPNTVFFYRHIHTTRNWFSFHFQSIGTIVLYPRKSMLKIWDQTPQLFLNNQLWNVQFFRSNSSSS